MAAEPPIRVSTLNIEYEKTGCRLLKPACCGLKPCFRAESAVCGVLSMVLSVLRKSPRVLGKSRRALSTSPRVLRKSHRALSTPLRVLRMALRITATADRAPGASKRVLVCDGGRWGILHRALSLNDGRIRERCSLPIALQRTLYNSAVCKFRPLNEQRVRHGALFACNQAADGYNWLDEFTGV